MNSSTSVSRKRLECESLEARLLLTGDVRFHTTGLGPELLTGLIAGEDRVFFSQGLVYENLQSIDIETGVIDGHDFSRQFFLEHTIGDNVYYVFSMNYEYLKEYDSATDVDRVLAPEGSVHGVGDAGYFYSPPAVAGEPTRFVWTNASSGQVVESATSLLTQVTGIEVAQTGIYFSATHQTRGKELFRFDMQTGVISIYDVNPAGSGNPGNQSVIGDDIYFTAEDDVHGRELRRADANGQFTTLDVNGTAADSFDIEFVQAVGDQLFFVSSENGTELHRVDGDSITTFDTVEGAGSFSQPQLLTAVGDDLYFSADDGVVGEQLWRLSGDTDTIDKIPLNLELPSRPQLAAHDTDLYFAASRLDVGEELFRLDTLTGTLDLLDLNPGTSGSEPNNLVVAGDWLFLGTSTQHEENRLTSVPLDFQRFRCDLTGEGACDGDDIDDLMAGLASGTSDEAFDLNGDGELDLADRDVWLSEAGRKNLGPGRSYLPGDANLDGEVDVSDFNLWNSNRLTVESRWTRGNFTTDTVVDVSDFNAWNSNKFTVSGNLVTLSNRAFEGRYVTESDDHNVFQDAAMRPSGQWFIHTTATGVTTLQNRESGRFLTADNWEVLTTDSPEVSLPGQSESWITVDNDDGSLAFRNLLSGRVMDGDGASDDWDVDESLEILFDDGWFVTPVDGTLSMLGRVEVVSASLEDSRENPSPTRFVRNALYDQIFRGEEEHHERLNLGEYH